MKHATKITISIISLVCVLALMATGVCAATNAGFSVINSVAYAYVNQMVTVNCYEVVPPAEPSLDEAPVLVKSFEYLEGKALGNELPTTGANASKNYEFTGWHTYDLVKKHYGETVYTSKSIVYGRDIGGYTLNLYEKYAPISDIPAGGGSVDLTDHGVTVTVDSNGNAKVVPIAGATNVIIPSEIMVGGELVPITTVEKGSDWSDATSIVFASPSNITVIESGTFGQGIWDGNGPSKLEVLILPRNLVSIESNNGIFGISTSGAINNLNNLRVLVIPASVLSIDKSAIRHVPVDCKVYCEAASKPSGWHDNWINGSLLSGEVPTDIYWGVGTTWDYDEESGMPYLLNATA